VNTRQCHQPREDIGELTFHLGAAFAPESTPEFSHFLNEPHEGLRPSALSVFLKVERLDLLLEVMNSHTASLAVEKHKAKVECAHEGDERDGTPGDQVERAAVLVFTHKTRVIGKHDDEHHDNRDKYAVDHL
jgi:hypothetical protein